MIFTSLVDDPEDPNALPAFVEACNKLPIGANVKANGDTPRMRLFDFIERLVTWEATTDEAILNTARELIQIATEGNPPPLLDPFAGGGSIPLEAHAAGTGGARQRPESRGRDDQQAQIEPAAIRQPDAGATRAIASRCSGTGWKARPALPPTALLRRMMREKAWEPSATCTRSTTAKR